MKSKTLLFALLAMFALSVSAHAQEDDPNHYLKKAMSKLETGDCRSAQMYYNVYTDLSGKKLSSLEKLIADCIAMGDTTQTYKVGDVIRVGNDLYTVANVTNNGKHGFAICQMGSGPMKTEYITGRKIPTYGEFEIIKANNTTLKLTGIFWTSEPSGSSCSNGPSYRSFGLGGYSNYTDCTTTYRSLLFVHRF